MVNGGTFFNRGGIPTVRGQVLRGHALLYRGGIPTVRGQVLRGDADFYCGGIPTVRGQVLHGGTCLTAVASPRFAVKFFMAALF